MLAVSRLRLSVQPRDEVGVLGAGQAALEGRLHGFGVAAHQGRRVEPEAGKDLATIEAGFVERQPNVFSCLCSTNQSIWRSSTRQTMYSRTPLRR